MNAHKSLWLAAHSLRGATLAIPFALMLPLGCNNTAPTQGSESVAAAPAAETAETSASETGVKAAHHGRHHGGATRMFFHAAKSLDLDATQTATIEGLKKQLHADGEAMRAPHQALHAALVAGVQAGKIDLEKIAPLQAAVKEAEAAHQASEAVALNGLWSALQPTQRTALVAAIRAKQSEHAAAWEAKREANAETPWQEKRLEHLTAELGLDPAQQKSVATIQAKQVSATPVQREERREVMKANREALLTAFASDRFDARELDLAAHGPKAGGGAGHAAFLAQLVPILRADQRTTLAAQMQQHGHQKG